MSPETLRRLQDEAITVYLPNGKAQMLQGGVGCIRLRPRERRGQPTWFVGASSTMVAHEGIVVALNQEHFDAVIGGVRETGAILCTVVGRLAYLPDEFDPLYHHTIGLPQLHIEVERLIPERPAKRGTFLATGAVLVRSDGHRAQSTPGPGPELARGIGAAYVSFEPGVRKSLDHACEWLGTAYAAGVMGGKVITDFDEQVRRFPGATFELKAVREGAVVDTDALNVFDRLHLSTHTRDLFIDRLEIKGDFVITGDQYNVSGQAGAVGPGARAENMSFVQLGESVPDAADLARELADLHTHLRSQVAEPQHDEALGMLAAAEREAGSGDAEAAVERLSGLRRLSVGGPWALGAATSVGTGVVAGLLRGILGV